nr:hypothetical protein [uncultured Flavobacterium sp.]
MKKYLILILISLFWNNLFAQIEDTDLQEMVIERVSRRNIIDIIEDIKKQTYRNYSEESSKYTITQQSFLNQKDTLLYVNSLYDLSMDLKSKKINKVKVTNPKNKDFLKEAFFSRYTNNDSPMYWLTEVIIRKNINIPELDFLNNINDYQYIRTTDKGITTITFFTDDYYEGFFKYDQKYNLVEIEFYLTKPYPIDHSQTNNGKQLFVKNWILNAEVVRIKFKQDKRGKIYIDRLTAYEEMRDYNFEKFDSKGNLIIQDDNLNFNSSLIIKKQ